MTVSADEELRRRLAVAPHRRLTGPFHRAVEFRWAGLAALGLVPGLLSGIPTMRSGGRFTPRNTFPTTHMALDPVTALAEAGGMFILTGRVSRKAAARPFTVVPIQGAIEHVLDLTDKAVLKSLGLSRAALLRPWLPEQLAGREALTQRLGRLAHDLGTIEAILAPSVRRPGGRNLAVFPRRIRPPSALAISDPERLLDESLP